MDATEEEDCDVTRGDGDGVVVVEVDVELSGRFFNLGGGPFGRDGGGDVGSAGFCCCGEEEEEEGAGALPKVNALLVAPPPFIDATGTARGEVVESNTRFENGLRSTHCESFPCGVVGREPSSVNSTSPKHTFFPLERLSHTDREME